MGSHRLPALLLVGFLEASGGAGGGGGVGGGKEAGGCPGLSWQPEGLPFSITGP